MKEYFKFGRNLSPNEGYKILYGTNDEPIAVIENAIADDFTKVWTKIPGANLLKEFMGDLKVSKEFVGTLIKTMEAFNLHPNLALIMLDAMTLFEDAIPLNKDNIQRVFNAYIDVFPSPYMRLMELSVDIKRFNDNKQNVKFQNAYYERGKADSDNSLAFGDGFEVELTDSKEKDNSHNTGLGLFTTSNEEIDPFENQEESNDLFTDNVQQEDNSEIKLNLSTDEELRDPFETKEELQDSADDNENIDFKLDIENDLDDEVPTAENEFNVDNVSGDIKLDFNVEGNIISDEKDTEDIFKLNPEEESNDGLSFGEADSQEDEESSISLEESEDNSFEISETNEDNDSQIYDDLTLPETDDSLVFNESEIKEETLSDEDNLFETDKQEEITSEPMVSLQPKENSNSFELDLGEETLNLNPTPILGTTDLTGDISFDNHTDNETLTEVQETPDLSKEELSALLAPNEEIVKDEITDDEITDDEITDDEELISLEESKSELPLIEEEPKQLVAVTVESPDIFQVVYENEAVSERKNNPPVLHDFQTPPETRDLNSIVDRVLEVLKKDNSGLADEFLEIKRQFQDVSSRLAKLEDEKIRRETTVVTDTRRRMNEAIETGKNVFDTIPNLPDKETHFKNTEIVRQRLLTDSDEISYIYRPITVMDVMGEQSQTVDLSHIDEERRKIVKSVLKSRGE